MPHPEMTPEPVAHGTYIMFVPVTQPNRVPPYKTLRWQVHAKRDNAALGEIKWYPGWRKYAFMPAPDTIFEQRCLRDIAEFIETKTDQQKTTGRAPKLKVK